MSEQLRLSGDSAAVHVGWIIPGSNQAAQDTIVTAIAIDRGDSGFAAQTAGLAAGIVGGVKLGGKGPAQGAKGVIKASETIGQPVEAVIGGRKRLLRVDIEPNGKLQIQSGGGKDSIVDFRPDLSKPLAPQINAAFKRLPQSARDQLVRNAEKGLKRLQETGNM